MTARRSTGIGFAAGLVLGALAVAGALRDGSSLPDAGAATAQELSASRRTAIVTAAQRVSAAVVSVGVTSTRVVDPFGGMFRDPYFEHFFPQYKEQVEGLGSGVIVDAGGLVLSNEHVVRNADKVSVRLPDGREFPATVLGTSATYDLAVLRIRGERLPVAPLGDSDGLVVGEWAIAIGNPFGQLLNDAQPTVTAGVISATRRDIRAGATETGVYKNMIQTDAAINPGNSGGPLVNGDGQVVGINTFILTPSGGSIGLGFAIPINLARRVLADVQKHGRVRTAWVGMQVQPVTPAMASRLGWREAGGLVVTNVEAGGPAANAGLRTRDRIWRVNDVLIRSWDDVQTSIYGASVGDRLAFEVERGGRRFRVTLTLAEAPRGRR